MYRKIAITTMVLAMMVWAVPFSVYAAGPNFGLAIYADGMPFGTKGVGPLPAPNEHNLQSYDKLYRIPTQPAVAEAAPGNPRYNGGRWNAYDVEWNVQPYLLISEADVLAAEAVGDVTITHANEYFGCPLLPMK